MNVTDLTCTELLRCFCYYPVPLIQRSFVSLSSILDLKFFCSCALGQINSKCDTWVAPVKLVHELSCVRANLDLPGLFASVSPADGLGLLVL